MDFFELAHAREAWERFAAAIGRRRTKVEELPLLDALGRTLAAPVLARADLPGFSRSTVDGFAVAARSTFGATDSLPAYLRLVGDIPMGQAPGRSLGTSETMRIATGGMLPAGADAVVMVEYTEGLAADEVGVLRPAAPGENVLRQGEDAAVGAALVAEGERLQAHHLGLLAAAGVTRAQVYRRPLVAILSSGDEIVPIEAEPGPAQVRDANSYSLAGAVLEAGGEPILWGILPDNFAAIDTALREAVQTADLVLISGGSSVGARDLSARAIAELGEPGILVHGVQVKPGKPTILAVAGDKPVVGLPGHPVSALVIFELLVRPALRLLQGLEPLAVVGGGLIVGGPAGGGVSGAALGGLADGALAGAAVGGALVEAELTRNVASRSGRLDVVQVALRRREGGGAAPAQQAAAGVGDAAPAGPAGPSAAPPAFLAEPIFGKSGALSTLAKADGWLAVPEAREGLRAGERVWVHLYPR